MFGCFVRHWQKLRSKIYADPLVIQNFGKEDVRLDEFEDKGGETYLAVRASGRLGRLVKTGPTILEVPHLLSDGSLGLELNETTVTHVKDEVKVFGWRYGDKIVEVNGYPVKTFEALWTRFLGARNRLPINFAILRKEFGPQEIPIEESESSYKEAQFVNTLPTKVGADGETEVEGKKIAIDPLGERADFLRLTSESEGFQQLNQTSNAFHSSSNSMAASSSHGKSSRRGHPASGLPAQHPPQLSRKQAMIEKAQNYAFEEAQPRPEKVTFVKDAYGRPMATSYPLPHR